MINKNIEEITKDNLQELIDNKEIENKTLEYKQALPGNSNEANVKFLASVSSFANASGGDIIYGIAEDRTTGKPKSLDGLDVDNVDQQILKLESIIRDGIKPRIIPAVTTKPVSLPNGKVAFIIRIPRSISSPHGVYYQGDKYGKFYSRSSNGKYPMDIGELRNAFNITETLIERIRNFRFDRISKIMANETPIPFYSTAKIALHLLPIASFNPAQFYDISSITSNFIKLPPLHAGGWSPMYNFDGFLTFSKDESQKSSSYVQLFKSGILEAVNGSMLSPDRKKLFSETYEKELIESLPKYLEILKSISVEPPIFIFISLFGVKGYSMAVNKGSFAQDGYTIDRDILLLPEIIVENYDTNATQLLKPGFDSIWNACGFKRSFNYNEKGDWSPR